MIVRTTWLSFELCYPIKYSGLEFFAADDIVTIFIWVAYLVNYWWNPWLTKCGPQAAPVNVWCRGAELGTPGGTAPLLSLLYTPQIIPSPKIEEAAHTTQTVHLKK